MRFRFGITMREVNSTEYYEPRDAIAKDWSNFMNKAFSGEKWLYIPNTKEHAVEFFNDWNLNVLILTGGDDIGITHVRDQTELKLLEHAVENDIPVIGICRGMQLVHSYFGGKLAKFDSEFVHKASTHKIVIEGKQRIVNSYHNGFIVEDTLNSKFKILARCTIDGSIEAFYNDKILAMMWHPERDKIINTWNLNLIEKFLSDGI